MADRPISDLPLLDVGDHGQYLRDDGMFVLEQDNTAYKLDGDSLKKYLNNATGITKIEKIGTSHLVDTYRITYNNTSTTFDVSNGRGIVSITKTSTAPTGDTYTITYNDGDPTTFVVPNGKGIESISKTGSTSTYDIYTITYNYGDPTTFNVPYGKDCTITNIATTYAGSSTASSIPASIYWKTSVSTAIDYYQTQEGQSIKGHYIWTRNIITFSTGSTNTSYSVAYQGIDGDSANELIAITTDSFTSLPKTISNSDITNTMVCVESLLSNPNAQAGNWSITTSNGSLTISGTFVGIEPTTATLYLMESR